MNDPLAARPKSFDREDWGSLDAEQARYLRRRVQFWKSVAGMLLLGVVLVVVIFFFRRSAICDRCHASLEHYARIAQALKLSEADVATLRLQWHNLDPAREGFAPSHYQLLPQNWTAAPGGGEEIPLAVCAYAHGALTGEGRNVLFGTPEGLQVRWVSESRAAEIAEQGVRSEAVLLQVH